jgi:succinate dehydrogenase / fumarate reductase membrane anchor subunit
MVRSVTSFGRSGLSDWLVQRVSAVIILAWFMCLLAILSLAAHAWIGMWAVGTDYLTERLMGPRGNVLRLAYQIGCSLVIFVYVIWGIQILWG